MGDFVNCYWAKLQSVGVIYRKVQTNCAILHTSRNVSLDAPADKHLIIYLLMASAVFCVFVQLNVHISFLSGKPIVENSSKIQLLALYYHFMLCNDCMQYFWNVKNLMQRLRSCRNKINAAFWLYVDYVRYSSWFFYCNLTVFGKHGLLYIMLDA